MEAALILLEDTGQVPTFEAVRALMRPPTLTAVPAITTPTLDLKLYDQLVATLAETEVVG